MTLRLCAFLLAFAFATSASTFAQTPPSTAEQQLDHMRAISTTQQMGTPGFHLKAAFQTFDYKGKPDGEGTVEEFFRQDGQWKRVLQYRGKQDVLVQTDALRHYADDDFLQGFIERALMNALFTPIPDAAARKDYTYRADTIVISNINMQCVVTFLQNHALQNSNERAPNTAYCTDPVTGALRLIQGHDFRNITFNRLAKLGGVFFARDIGITEGGVTRAKLQVTTLEPAPTLSDADLQPPSLPKFVHVNDQPEFVKGKLIHAGELHYNAGAAHRQVQGCVQVAVLISKDGKVRDAEVLSAPDDALVLSAMDSAWDWRYLPFTVDGKPVDVEAKLSFGFNYKEHEKNPCVAP
jgi:TonB family protein